MARLITPEAILSYPTLFEPRAVKGDDKSEPKYSAALVFVPEAQKDPLYKAMKAAVV